jgi:hypothetical protein
MEKDFKIKSWPLGMQQSRPTQPGHIVAEGRAAHCQARPSPVAHEQQCVTPASSARPAAVRQCADDPKAFTASIHKVPCTRRVSS